MAKVIINLPEAKYNQLNNFYLENFGYDIHTQLMNFLSDEMRVCESYSEEPARPRPHPTISAHGQDGYILRVYYPDGSTSNFSNKDYEVLLDVWNEWSKYNFSKQSLEKVIVKTVPKKSKQHVFLSKGRYHIQKFIKGKRIYWYSYDLFDEAVEVRDFLLEHEWDKKYFPKNLMKQIPNCNKLNYSKYLLRIARGEMEL